MLRDIDEKIFITIDIMLIIILIYIQRNLFLYPILDKIMQGH